MIAAGAATPPPPLRSDAPLLVRLPTLFQQFVATAYAGGIVLLVSTVIALLWANSPWFQSYHDLWHIPLTLKFGEWGIEEDLHYWINDGLMVLFFLLVGLEIKREFQVGELSSPKYAALPIAAAVGGMLAPAGIYLLFNSGGEFVRGWGVPMATDIAFALGILSLLGPRVPLGLKVFLAALAIVDDLGAVLVIALFYSGALNWGMLGIAAACLVVLMIFNRSGVQKTVPYALVGIVLWLAILQSGVHATIAGVLLALTIPTRTKLNPAAFLSRGRAALNDFEHSNDENGVVLTNAWQQDAIHRLESACEQVAPPLQRMEHGLAPWVAFLIMPLFALSNAGVHLHGDLGAILGGPLALGIMGGLLIGKPLGIVGISWIAVRMGWAYLPRGVSWKQLTGAGFLGGIGFTMALFVAGLAFGKGETLDMGKLAILLASFIAAIIGSIILLRSTSAAGVTRELAVPAVTPSSDS